MRAWGDLEEICCPKCGRPAAIHEIDKTEDYSVARATCTATLAVEKTVARWWNSPEGKRAQKERETTGFDRSNADAWFSFTASEGAPNFERETINDG